MAPSTLIFPQGVNSLQADRSAIRSQLRDTYNRLHSIGEDSSFIDEKVRAAYPDFPIVANQRAGSWYVRPRGESAHAYFKSTDGHAGVHNFNLRRANLVLLPLIREKGGIVLVDSTRRGKRFPDALSKTIPLWCAVLNRARVKLLPPSSDNSTASAEDWERDGALWTLPSAIGRSEHSQIESKIEEWSESLCASSYDLTSLKDLEKPLRPIFVSPSSVLKTSSAAGFAAFYPVVCASASKLASEADGMERARGFTYVQGSGDDHEAWSKGLTARDFWAHYNEIMSASREDIDDVIATILDSAPPSLAGLSLSASSTSSSTSLRNTNTTLELSTLPVLPPPIDSTLILIRAAKGPLDPASQPTNEDESAPFILHARTGKQGYHAFFDSIEAPVHRSEVALREGKRVDVRVEVCDPQGEANDLGLAFLVVLFARSFSDDGTLKAATDEPNAVTKPLIRSRLQWILEAFPTVNPSRAVLNRINEHLMSGKAKAIAESNSIWNRS